MPLPNAVVDLLKRFERNIEAYRSGQYNETQVRLEFVDPLFKALGWDIHNEKGYAEAYKDVIHEESVKIGGATKAPDYSFRIGGVRKFFVETKKPSVNLKEDVSPAYQLRRYAWSAKLPLSILTDFEEFVVYDCRVRPVKTDSAAIARVMYLTYKEYETRWNEIAEILSRDAVLKGSFDKFAESTKVKKGTAQVDDAFLKEIDSWRDTLARTIALRNPKLTQRELNYSVQVTIDRIIFLRISEDRGIEEYGRLMALQNGTSVYKRLVELFYRADERYNSGLFHFQSERDRPTPIDELTPGLEIDDKVLKDILKRLYYPESPYEFSVLSADILGQVYEQFLGKVIRLTAGHRAAVEDKPEVKKAGGVYYTPTYIVDYIVKNTVGKLLDDEKQSPLLLGEGKGEVSVRETPSLPSPNPVGEHGTQKARRGRDFRLTPKQAARLRILDPACGSGSFLLGAYQHLLDWHLQWYIADGHEKHPKELYEAAGGDWRLTTAERKRILLNNIYGVDIDPQAVEVTKLSLLLKVLEGENDQTLSRQIRFFHERALPDLGNNIKCGNSLIGPDFYDGEQLSLMDDEERMRINAFDWKKEFKEVFREESLPLLGGDKEGVNGFDAVIGNPPWGAYFTEPELEYLRRKNKAIIVRMIDSFMYFVNQFSIKVTRNGSLGMILPDVILYQSDNEKLRATLIQNFLLKNVLNMGDVFEKVTRPSSILIFKNSIVGNRRMIEVADFSKLSKAEKRLEIWNVNNFQEIAQDRVRKLPGFLFLTSSLASFDIWSKIKTNTHQLLEEVVDSDGIQRGVSPDLKEAFILDSKTARGLSLEKQNLRKVLTGGKQVKRYSILESDLKLIYTQRNDDFPQLPKICAYIDRFKSQITCKEVKQGKHPIYSLHRSRDENIFSKKEKLIGVITEDEIILALDENQLFATDGLYVFAVREQYNIRYIMAILNSRLFVFLYRLLSFEKGRVLAQVKPQLLEKMPIRSINKLDKAETARHDKMVALVEQMLELHKQLAAAKTEHEKTALQRQIDATDKQIDQLVYELYGLTEEEKRIVEDHK